MTPSSRESAIQARLDAAKFPELQQYVYGLSMVIAYAEDDEMVVAQVARIPEADVLTNAPADLAYLLAENADLRARIDRALALAHKPGAHKEHVLAALTDEGKE